MENIDWQNLKFGYIPTNYNVRCYYRNGKWGEIEVTYFLYTKHFFSDTPSPKNHKTIPLCRREYVKMLSMLYVMTRLASHAANRQACNP